MASQPALGRCLWQDHDDGRVLLVTAALLFAFALLLWAFAMLLWDLLRGRLRRWLRVVLVAILTPACALAATLISAVAGLALVTALEPDGAPVGPSEPRVRNEPAEPATTSERTTLETTPGGTASPFASPSPSPSAAPSATPSATPPATPSPSASPEPPA